MSFAGKGNNYSLKESTLSSIGGNKEISNNYSRFIPGYSLKVPPDYIKYFSGYIHFDNVCSIFYHFHIKVLAFVS